jgi:hypothetical protein
VEHSPACRVWSQCHERASNSRGAATRLETLGVYIPEASVMLDDCTRGKTRQLSLLRRLGQGASDKSITWRAIS